MHQKQDMPFFRRAVIATLVSTMVAGQAFAATDAVFGVGGKGGESRQEMKANMQQSGSQRTFS